MNTQMMKAAIYRRYGPPDVIHLEEIPRPAPEAGCLLVRSCGSSVNPLDLRIRRGVMRPLTGLIGPGRKIPGADVSGEVVAAGRGVARFKEGDSVYALLDPLRGGACAEYVVVPEKLAAQRPKNITGAEAAAVPLTAEAALQALRDIGHIDDGMGVLVIGASGGVGIYAVQIARSFGASVTGVGPPDSMALLRSIGADAAVDYTVEDFTAGKNRYDIVFDVVGSSSFWQCRAVLKPGGVYIATTPSLSLPPAMVCTTLLPGKKARLLMTRPSGEDLTFITGLVESGTIKPVIDRTYPLDQTADAHRHLEQGPVRGKIVVTI